MRGPDQFHSRGLALFSGLKKSASQFLSLPSSEYQNIDSYLSIYHNSLMMRMSNNLRMASEDILLLLKTQVMVHKTDIYYSHFIQHFYRESCLAAMEQITFQLQGPKIKHFT